MLENLENFFLINALAGENVDAAVGAIVVLPHYSGTYSETT